MMVYCNTVQTQDIKNHFIIESVQLILTFETTHILKQLTCFKKEIFSVNLYI